MSNTNTNNLKTFNIQLEEVEAQAETLKKQRDALDLDSRKWTGLRDALNLRKSEAWNEVNVYRDKREEANEAVKRLKRLRSDLVAQLKKRRKVYLSLKEKGSMSLRRISRSISSVKQQIDTLDWKIQTNPLAPAEEKEVVEQIRLLEKQLLIYEDAKNLKEKLIGIRAELDVLRIRCNEIHGQINESLNKSREYHKKMLEKMSEINAFKEKADDAHWRSVELRKVANEVHRNYLEITEQIRKLRRNIEEAENAEYKERAIRHTKTAIEVAYNKLKEGKKITLEEFKLLKEKELI